jgi:hypothetical protein
MANAVTTRLPVERRRVTLVSVIRSTLQRKLPRETPLRTALPYVAAAAAAAVFATALGVGLPVRVGLPLMFLAVGLQRALDASARRARLRTRADAWLANAASPNPEVFAWRVEELLGSERRGVADALSAYAQEIVRPWRPGAPPLNRRRLRADAELLAAVADALKDDRRELSPRAVLSARELVIDVGGPLHAAARHGELRQRLVELLADAERRPLSSAERMELSPTSDGFGDR